MKTFYFKFYLLAVVCFLGIQSGFGQTTIFNEAGGGSAPAGWIFDNNVTSNDIDRGSYWLVEDGTPNDFITTATFDLSTYASAEFTLDVATFGSGADNSAKIEFSFDGGSNYTQIEVSNTPSSSTYINGGTFTLNSLSNQVVIRISSNGSTGRDVRLRDLILTASGTSGGSCSVTSLSLANIACDDNSTTADASDDFITFDLNPTGSNLGASYNVSVSSGTVSPTSGTYGASTSFSLNTGSAGGGDVDVTITDVDDATCSATETITDPGSCSSGGGGSSTCGVEIDFETAGSGYSTSEAEFVDSNEDYFSQTDGSNINAVLSNADGSFFAAQDIDEQYTLPVDLEITNINISTLSNLEFSIDLAEGDDGSNEDWDVGDYVRIYYSIDGAIEQNLLWIENDGSTFNSAPFIDTDFDGTGDGTEITDAFTTFTESIASTGSLMDIRIEFSLDAGDEDIAIDNIKVCGTPASSNNSDSDIVATNFDPTDNIDYTLYNASSGLTTLNAIKVGEFEIRDGGATNDADAVGTILTDLDLDITNFDNLAAIALFDGSTNISEVTTPMATTSFLSINSGSGITASDDGTKTFEVYVTFNSTVTDNEQLVLNISSAVADGANGSVFSAIDAGGSSTPTIGDDNRIEVTASDLIFDQNVSDVEVSTVMSPSPTVVAIDANVNTDLDYTASVSLSVSTTNFDASATTDVNAVDGVATFSNLIFDNTSTGSILTASSGTLNNDTSGTFEVFTAPITIAIEDFDGSTPSWTNTTDVDFFDNGFGSDGFFGIIDISSASPISNANFTNNILGENDLDDEGDNGTTGFATTTFEEISVENFSNLSLSFDWEVIGYNANNDDAKYELFIDGSSQGEVFLLDGNGVPEDGSGSVSISIPDNSSTVSLEVSIRNNGGGGYSGFDNFKIEGNYDGDLIYSGGTWTPSAPNASTGTDDALVQDGTYTTSGDVILNSITVLGDAVAEVSPADVITINEDIYNNGTFTFKSNATESAQFGNTSGVDITGNVTVERYIPAGLPDVRRAFRFLTSSVNTTGSINDNWQEGVNNTGTNFPTDNQNPNPGFGIHISGGDASLGFDQTGTNNPSMFTFDNSEPGPQANAWTQVPNTNTITLKAGEAYLTFVRGDRSIDVTDNNTTPTNTTLRATGDLHTGPRVFSSANNATSLEYGLNDQADLFSLVGNPYQAIVDINNLDFTNINSMNYWVWDPNLGTRGNYATVTLPGGTNTTSSPANQFIQPGQSFFVQTIANGTASLTFNEDDKDVSGTATSIFSEQDNPSIKMLLYSTEALNNDERESDGLIINFAENANNGLDIFDADKLLGPDENLARLQDNELVSIEQRDYPTSSEALALSTSGYTSDNYSFVVYSTNIQDNFEAYILDEYTGTQTLLNEGITQIDFTVDEGIPASIDQERFKLVFETETFSTTENNFGAYFSLYPNPTDGQFNIKTPNLSGEVNVEISSLLGQKVYNQKLSLENQQVNVNVGKLSAGVYIVTLSQDNQSFSTKLIVE